MPRTKKLTRQEADAATIADPTKKNPMVDAVAPSEIKDDHKVNPDAKKGAQDTVNKDAPGGATSAAPTRKPLGTKEVIPFAWKVIGVSGEMVLTLFKSIEREDSEAHLARLGKDGVYRDLRLVEADFKIVQPKSVRAVLAANEKKSQTIAPPKKGKKKKAGATAATIKLPKRKTTTSAAKKTKKTEKTKKTVRASATKKKKVKKAAKKPASKTVKAKKSAKQAVKKKTKTKSSKKKTKAKKK